MVLLLPDTIQKPTGTSRASLCLSLWTYLLSWMCFDIPMRNGGKWSVETASNKILIMFTRWTHVLLSNCSLRIHSNFRHEASYFISFRWQYLDVGLRSVWLRHVSSFLDTLQTTLNKYFVVQLMLYQMGWAVSNTSNAVHACCLLGKTSWMSFAMNTSLVQHRGRRQGYLLRKSPMGWILTVADWYFLSNTSHCW